MVCGNGMMVWLTFVFGVLLIVFMLVCVPFDSTVLLRRVPAAVHDMSGMVMLLVMLCAVLVITMVVLDVSHVLLPSRCWW